MSIFDVSGQGRPRAQSSLRIFVNRFDAARDLALRINGAPPTTILFYTGVGGNGKTALLRHFQAHCCFQLPPEEWEEVQSYPDEFFTESLAQAPGAVEVPVAYLDFGARPSGADRPQEMLNGVFLLKRQLARYDISTPRFDFAAVTYLYKVGGDVETLVRELFPDKERGLAIDLVDALISLPVLRVGATLFELVNRKIDDVYRRRRLRRRVPPDTAAEIISLHPEPDLAEELPRMFAEDLKEALGTPGRHNRIVLLFDTYEAFGGEAAGGGRLRIVDLGGPRWVRYLLGHLPIADGVIVIVAGRTAPRWADAPVAPIPDRFVEVRALSPLPADIAERYLVEAGVPDPAMRAALTGYASVEPGQVHPLLLGLCADVVLAASARGTTLDPLDFHEVPELRDKERVLASRLLSWVEPTLEAAIVAVSAPRSFDAGLFSLLGARLGFDARPADFAKVAAFSFVTPVDHPAGLPGSPQRGVYEVHRLLRRALRHAEPELMRRAHEVLHAHFADLAADGDQTAVPDEIFHRNRLDPAAGIELWRQNMRRALAVSRYDRCRSLITLLAELTLPTPQDTQTCTYLVARAELGLGRWAQAEQLAAGLDPHSPYTSLLRSDLAFVRGDVEDAQRHADQALAAASDADRLAVLFRSAELRLFLGRFDEGRRLCREGLALCVGGAEAGPNDVARWNNLLGEIEFFAGDVDRAVALFASALNDLNVLDDEDRDLALYAAVLQNHALVAEAGGRPGDVRRAQEQALSIRRNIGDARGVAHSLHGMGIAAAQLKDTVEAERLFSEAAVVARNLGEDLLFAKISRARGEAAVAAGRLDDATRLIDEAQADFERCGIPYDVAHARLTRGLLHRARGDTRASLTELDQVRQLVERGGHHSLFVRHPGADVPAAERIAEGMLAFAAGDALGVPWEGRTPDQIDPDRITELPARDDWPRGAASDDTAQMMLVVRALADTAGRPTPEVFLRLLADALPTMRGVGPTTGAAVARFRATGELLQLPGQGTTNGAAMRIAGVGWAVPAAYPDRRRDLVHTFAEVTHRAHGAVAAACLIAAMATWALEGVDADGLVTAGLDELDWFTAQHPAAETDVHVIRQAAAGEWRPGPHGVPLDAVVTVASVIHVLRTVSDLKAALVYAVSLGGDTDTVAALVGGLLGCRGTGEVAGLPWLGQVAFEERPQVEGLAAQLREIRRSWYAS